MDSLASIAIAAQLVLLLVSVRNGVLIRRERLILTDVESARFADGSAAILPLAALPLRVTRELAWAEILGVSVAFAVWDGGELAADTRQAMRRGMRAHESLFELGAGRWLTVLWDVDELGAVLALARLTGLATSAGACGPSDLRAAFALYPHDGEDQETLVKRASSRLQPMPRWLELAQRVQQLRSPTGYPAAAAPDSEERSRVIAA